MISLKTTIYLDVLFLINLYITYILLKASFRLINVKVKRRRLVLSSFLGGAFSLIILLELNFIELLAIRLLMGLSLVYLSLGRCKLTLFLKASFIFYIVNFVFGGGIFLIFTFFPINEMAYKNGAVYFNISAIELLLSTTAAYLLVNGIALVMNSRNRREEISEVKIALNGNETMVNALLDTGNKLTDLFSGLPVMVCEESSLKGLLKTGFRRSVSEAEIKGEKLPAGFRLIPIETVAGKSLLPAVKCDYIELSGKRRSVIIAVTDKPLSDGSFNAILNTNLL